MSTAISAFAPLRADALSAVRRRRPHAVVLGVIDRLRRTWRQRSDSLRVDQDGRIAGAAPPAARSSSVVADETPPTVGALYHHRRLAMVRLALLLVDDLPTAEDVVQDAFAALIRRHGDRLAGLDDPEAYLRRSVVNTARSVLRRRRTARDHVPERTPDPPPPDERLILREEHHEVLTALAQLTRRQREVLVLRYWSNLSEAQIADTLGLAPGTVKSTASRALDALGRRLGHRR